MGIRGQYKNKRDANEPEIITTLEAHGIGVVTLDTPCDLMCLYGGAVKLAEVKAPNGPFTPAQKRFYEAWPGYVTVLRTNDEATEFAREFRGVK